MEELENLVTVVLNDWRTNKYGSKHLLENIEPQITVKELKKLICTNVEGPGTDESLVLFTGPLRMVDEEFLRRYMSSEDTKISVLVHSCELITVKVVGSFCSRRLASFGWCGPGGGMRPLRVEIDKNESIETLRSLIASRLKLGDEPLSEAVLQLWFRGVELQNQGQKLADCGVTNGSKITAWTGVLHCWVIGKR